MSQREFTEKTLAFSINPRSFTFSINRTIFLKSFRQAKKCAKQNIVLFYSSAKSFSETHFKEQNSTIYIVFKTFFCRYNILKISYSFEIVYGWHNRVRKY
jgi:hypothetical protein